MILMLTIVGSFSCFLSLLSTESMQVDACAGDAATAMTTSPADTTVTSSELLHSVADIAVQEQVVLDVLPIFVDRLHSLDKSK